MDRGCLAWGHGGENRPRGGADTRTDSTATRGTFSNMSEILVFLSTARDAGGIYLLIVLAVALGFLFFDRRRVQLRVMTGTKSREDIAA